MTPTAIATMAIQLIGTIAAGAIGVWGSSRKARNRARRDGRDKDAALDWRYEVKKTARQHNARCHLTDGAEITLPTAPEWMTTDEPDDPPFPLPPTIKLGG